MHPKVLLETCTDLVAQVLRLEHPADAVVSRFFRQHRHLGPRERATLAETAYAVLRKKLLYEYLARSGSGARERRLTILGFHAPRDFLKSALTDQEKVWLDHCDAIADSELLAQHRHNLPQWVAQALEQQVGDAFEPLAQSLQQAAPLDVRVNVLKAKRQDVLQELQAAGLDVALCPYSPWGLRLQGKPALNKLDAFTRGAIEVQDEGSQLLALLVDAHRGEMVADFCAGAGGKTLAMGATMRNTGRLYAFDTSAHRLDALKPRLARSGLSNVHPVALAHERDDRVKRLSGKLNRVLVDAPCSGLGTLRRNPDLKWRQSPQAIEELQQKQSSILNSAARLLQSGGRLVYATCSILQAENETVAQQFSTQHPEFKPVPVAELLTQLKVADAHKLCASEQGMYLRLWPHAHATDGFFAAVWERQ